VRYDIYIYIYIIRRLKVNDIFRWHTCLTDEILPTESYWNNYFIHAEGNAMKIILGVSGDENKDFKSNSS
jgi:hypothetical protein